MTYENYYSETDKEEQEDVTVFDEETVYINSIEVMAGKNDGVLIMRSNSPRGIEKELNIMVSPATLKHLADTTSDIVTKYESAFGELPESDIKFLRTPEDE